MRVYMKLEFLGGAYATHIHACIHMSSYTRTHTHTHTEMYVYRSWSLFEVLGDAFVNDVPNEGFLASAKSNLGGLTCMT